MHHSNIATMAAIVHSLKQHYINRGNGIYSHLNFCKAHLALLLLAIALCHSMTSSEGKKVLQNFRTANRRTIIRGASPVGENLI